MSEAEDYRAGLNALTQPDAPGVNPLGVSTGGVDDPRYVPAQTDKYGMPLGLAAQTMTRDDAPFPVGVRANPTVNRIPDPTFSNFLNAEERMRRGVLPITENQGPAALIGGMTEAQLYDLLPPDAPRGGQFYMDGTEIKYLPPISEPPASAKYQETYGGITSLPSTDSMANPAAFVTYTAGRPDLSLVTTGNDFGGVFKEDPNLGPAARTLGNILSMQSGLGSIPKAGPAAANVFGRGARKLGESIQKIPVVGGVAKTIGDVANVIAKPIENLVQDSTGPLGIVGGLIKNRPGILFPKTPEQQIDPSVMNTKQDVQNFVQSLGKAPEQKIDPNVMNTRQDVQALTKSLGGYQGALLGSSPFASSYTPKIGEDIITGRQDSSTRNVPNYTGTIESGDFDIFDTNYDQPVVETSFARTPSGSVLGTSGFASNIPYQRVSSVGGGGGFGGSGGFGGGSGGFVFTKEHLQDAGG